MRPGRDRATCVGAGRSVIYSLKDGSPIQVTPLLKQWREARPALRPVDIAINPAIVELLGRQVADTLADAQAIADVEREAEKH